MSPFRILYRCLFTLECPACVCLGPGVYVSPAFWINMVIVLAITHSFIVSYSNLSFVGGVCYVHMHVTRQREFYVTFFKSLLRIVLAEVILLVLSACCAVTPFEEIHQICSKSVLDFNIKRLCMASGTASNKTTYY